MLEAIIFDIGNVLLRFDFNRAVGRIAPHCTIPTEEIAHRMEPLKMDLESGRIGGDAFLETLAQTLAYTGGKPLLKQAWQEIFDPIEATHALVQQLSARIPLFLLSNTNDLHADYFLGRYPVFQHFRDAVYSHKAGLMKPDPAIYAHTLTRFNLLPEKVFFIDDLAANIESAHAAGWHAHQYKEAEHSALLAHLQRLGL